MKKLFPKVNWSALILELLMIFLGVTAGFMLNDWGVEQEERQLEIKYKQALLKDLNTNLLGLQSHIEMDSLWLERTSTLLNLIEEKPETKFDSLYTIFDLTTTQRSILTQKATYESMENSGDINLIRDFDLKTQIISYYNQSVKQVEFGEQYLKNFFNEHVIPLALRTLDRHQKKFLNPQKDGTQYLNNLVSVYNGKIQLLNYYRNMQGHSLYLKGALEKSIE